MWLTPLNLKLDESNKIIPVETLKGVSDPAMKNIFKMSREAEDAEKNFNSAIAKVGYTIFVFWSNIPVDESWFLN